jgi:hypothetical protein
MRARAHGAHVIPHRAPLFLEVGDKVKIAERSSRWPAFVFVTTAKGEGWVPSRHISIHDGVGIAVVAYDTTELPMVQGDVVTVVERDDRSEWWWCRSASGALGWVPVEVLTPQK